MVIFLIFVIAIWLLILVFKPKAISREEYQLREIKDLYRDGIMDYADYKLIMVNHLGEQEAHKRLEAEKTKP
jgi:hypothetical protein